MIHGGVDGYSRLVVYCRCSSNNRANTVLQCFLDAVDEFGLPSRVRCDQGTENYDVGYYMLSHPLRGEGRSSIIAGQSIHNQRVERFWRDLFTGCTGVFYHLFYHMEDNELLNPDLSTHLWCLHFIYTIFINNSISRFIDAWSNHPLRTEHNRTPRQLYVEGMLRNSGSNITCVNEAFDETEV